MHNFSKLILATGGALALSLPLASPALARAQQDILVTSAGDMERWQKATTRDLNRKLEMAERISRSGSAQGIVQLRFTLDADGTAQGIKVYSRTPSTSGVRAAKWAIRRMNGFGDAPVANALGQIYQANIIFAKTEQQKMQLAKQLAASERTRLASANGGAMVVALGN